MCGGGGGGGGGDRGGDEDNETDKLGVGVEMLLSALDVTEGSGNLYLTNVAVMGCSCDKGATA